MKRKLIIGLLSTFIIGALLVGCGNSSDVDNTTNSETTNNDTDKDTTTNENETESEISGNVGDVTGNTENTNDVNTEEKEVIVRTYSFPKDVSVNGYTVKEIEDINVDWSINKTYAAFSNGRIMTFSWESVNDCGVKVNASKSGKTMYLWTNDGKTYLSAWVETWTETEYEDVKSMSKEDIVALNAAAAPYVENGYYDMEVTDTTIRITFAVDNPETKVKGYACYIIDNNNKIVYQFNYKESYDIYNDARAMDVVNSIEYVELPAEPNVE